MEKDVTFERRFQQVNVNKPSISDTIRIFEGQKTRYGKHHGVRIQTQALVVAAQLSVRYTLVHITYHFGFCNCLPYYRFRSCDYFISLLECNIEYSYTFFSYSERRLPDKAIDLVDEACANVSI